MAIFTEFAERNVEEPDGYRQVRQAITVNKQSLSQREWVQFRIKLRFARHFKYFTILCVEHDGSKFFLFFG